MKWPRCLNREDRPPEGPERQQRPGCPRRRRRVLHAPLATNQLVDVPGASRPRLAKMAKRPGEETRRPLPDPASGRPLQLGKTPPTVAESSHNKTPRASLALMVVAPGNRPGSSSCSKWPDNPTNVGLMERLAPLCASSSQQPRQLAASLRSPPAPRPGPVRP